MGKGQAGPAVYEDENHGGAAAWGEGAGHSCEVSGLILVSGNGDVTLRSRVGQMSTAHVEL